MMNMKRPNGYDFHCHIDLYPDPVKLISECDDKRIFTLAVTTTPKAWPQNVEWTQRSNFVVPAVGLHPELVGDRYQEVALMEQYIKDSPLVGEVGLDGSPRYKSSWDKQIEVFARALKQAQKIGGRVVSIHSRRAEKEVVDMINVLTTPDRVLCILHWYAGSKTIALKAAETGCYFSVNAQMLSSKHGAGIIGALRSERILTETDGPFTREHERSSRPDDVVRLLSWIADARHCAIQEMEDIINQNARNAFLAAGINT